MKKFFFALIALLAVPCMQAQVLVKEHQFHPKQYNDGYYDVEPSFVLKCEFNIEPISTCMGPRARWEFEDNGMALPAEYSQHIIQFAGHHDNGQYFVSMRHFEDGSNDYVLHLFNNMDRCYKSIELTALYDRFSQIDHFTYSRGRYYFNMVPIDYGTEGPEYQNYYKVLCYDPEEEKLVWESDVHSSRDLFIVTDDYVIAGFGGYEAEDFIRLIDIKTGNTLCQCPMPTQPTAMGMAGDTIFFEDYQGELYRYRVSKQGVRVKGKGVRLRRGPSTSDEIFTDKFTGKIVYTLNEDVLPYLGESGEWYKIRFMDETLYISKQFSELYKGEKDSPEMLAFDAWNKAEMKRCYQPVSKPYFQMEVDLGDGSDKLSILCNNSSAALFVPELGSKTLVVTGEPYSIHIYPSLKCIRYYEGNALGMEDERLYFIRDNKVVETWLHNSDPQGNVWKEGEVEVKSEYIKIINGKASKCTEKEFFDKASIVENVEEFNILENFDL